MSSPGLWISPGAARGATSGTGDGVDKTFEHVQSTPSNQWIVQHNLGKYASITVINTSGDEMWCDVRHNSKNQITLKFSRAFSGTAFCN